MISCCTMCVHFPDGLSSLLPDLVCVVLHSPVICESSHTAFVALHPFIHITQICTEFATFAVLCSVFSLGLCAIICTCFAVLRTKQSLSVFLSISYLGSV